MRVLRDHALAPAQRRQVIALRVPLVVRHVAIDVEHAVGIENDRLELGVRLELDLEPCGVGLFLARPDAPLAPGFGWFLTLFRFVRDEGPLDRQRDAQVAVALDQDLDQVGVLALLLLRRL